MHNILQSVIKGLRSASGRKDLSAIVEAHERGSGATRTSDGTDLDVSVRSKVPRLQHDDLADNIRHFQALAEDVLRECAADSGNALGEALAVLQETLQVFPASTGDPVWIMSTGRCGTLALQKFLEAEPATQPFHRGITSAVPQEDRTRYLHQFALRTFDAKTVENMLLQTLVRCLVDYLRAQRAGRQFVMVSHGHTTSAPMLRAIFPSSRFLHLRRNYKDVFMSYLTKRQFYGQLEPRAAQVTDDGLRLSDPNYDLVEQIVWYLYATDVFSSAFVSAMPEGVASLIESEDMFAGEQATYDQLCDFFPGLTVDLAGYNKQFSSKVNAKLGKLTPLKSQDKQELLSRIDLLWQQLEQTGRLE